MALAAFAALAEIGISAYSSYEQGQQQQVAATDAQQQQQGMEQSGAAQNEQNAVSSGYDEQWMQLKTLSHQLYGDAQQPPTTLTGQVGGLPPK